MSSFVPRLTFPYIDSLPRSYFLGHHRSALAQMRARLSSTDLVIECRDARLPLSSRNPLFESMMMSSSTSSSSSSSASASTSGKPRVIVYLSRDLAGPTDTSQLGLAARRALVEQQNLVREADHPHQVFWVDNKNHTDRKALLTYLAAFASARASSAGSLAPAAALIVGMPNVGKSTLLNGLRRKSRLGATNIGGGGGGKKVARTGALPGVTRKIGTAVKIVQGQDADESGSMYILDTPGVFVPYISSQQDMLALALCGTIKDSLFTSPLILADYLLFRLNRVDPQLYDEWSAPTNRIEELLARVAHATGRRRKRQVLDLEASAVWLIKRYRDGKLGRFVLDEVSEEAFQRRRDREAGVVPAMKMHTGSSASASSSSSSRSTA